MNNADTVNRRIYVALEGDILIGILLQITMMRSSKMAAGSGRVAIFLHLHNGDRKTRPRSWLTSFPAPPSWIQDGGATSNVWRTSELPWNLQKGVILFQKKSPIDVWSYFFYFSIEIQKSIWSLASPNHSPNGSTPLLVLIAWDGRTRAWLWWGRSSVLPLS